MTLPAPASADGGASRPAPRVLAVVSQEHTGLFLPEALQQALAEEAETFDIVHPEQHGDWDWLSLLRERQAEVLLTAWSTPPLPADLPMDELSLRYLCNLTGGIRNYVPKALLERGLVVTNWGNSIARTVAECALLFLLMGFRNFGRFHTLMHAERGWTWDRTGLHSLFERRIGLHGLGRISQELVTLLQPFQCRIQAFSPSVPDALMEQLGVERATTLEGLFGDNDAVVELASLTDKTRGMVQEKHLRLLPEDGVFVNVGRGGVVDEGALLTLAREGRLRLCLDVFHSEPLPEDSPLRGLDNVLLLPHMAGPTVDRLQDACRLALANIRHYKAGEPLEAVVPVERYDSMT